MNRDWREKRIRQLFNELGREDERKAPGFANVLQAVLMRSRGPGRRLRFWRLAAVVAMPVLAIVVALLLLASHSTGPAPPGDFTTLQTIPSPVPSNPGLSPEIVPPTYMGHFRPVPLKRSQWRRPASPTHDSTVLISQWQSPTNFLLRVPGNELLKSLPRVPDSSPGITKSLIEKHN
jgi:hypothetical protein